jgi:hypothetical protein
LRREFETLGVRANARRFDRAIYQRFKSEFDVLELQAAALNACEIKNVINQAEQRLPVVGDDVEELMMFRLSGVSSSSSVIPRTAFNAVLISWDMLERNSDLARDAFRGASRAVTRSAVRCGPDARCAG